MDTPVYGFKDNWGKYYLNDVINFVERFNDQYNLDDLDEIVQLIENFGDQYDDEYFTQKIQQLIVADPAMDSESTNPLQNKVITEEISNIENQINDLIDNVWYKNDSRNANTVLASPNGSAGAATFRKLAAADIPSLPANKITSGTFSVDRIPSIPITKVSPIFYQAHGNGTKNISAGVITLCELVSTNAINSGSGLSISNSGIKIANAGIYRITGSVYIGRQTSDPTTRSCFIYRMPNGNRFNNERTYEICASHLGSEVQGAVNCGPIMLRCNANDIIYLAGRAGNKAGNFDRDNDATYLLVERVS